MQSLTGGERLHIAPGVYYWIPAWQDCVCGEKREDWNQSGSRRYYRCCSVAYLKDKIVAVGPIWLDAPMRPKVQPSRHQLLAVMSAAPAPPRGMTTALYRRFDGAGVLLYLGITDDLPARSRWHERHSPWAPFVRRRTTHWFTTRSAAEAAEKTAIKAELPLFNKQHAAFDQRHEAARYLLQRGRIRLVEQVPLISSQK